MSSSQLTVRDLRRRWKPHKERLGNHPTAIRFHRACSWFQRSHELAEVDLDFSLIARWIAFNALYGQWSEDRREPLPEERAWRGFLDRILGLDADDHIAEMLKEHKRLVISLLEEEHLSRYFWDEPGELRARKSRKGKFEAQTWYLEKNWKLVLDRGVERVYLLRCQLVHGAATHSGKLNRDAVRRCNVFLGHLLNAVLLVWIDRGADADWGSMCYPPLRQGTGSRR